MQYCKESSDTPTKFISKDQSLKVIEVKIKKRNQRLESHPIILNFIAMKNTVKISIWIYKLCIVAFTTALIIGFYKANI